MPNVEDPTRTNCLLADACRLMLAASHATLALES